jgi:AraC family transcriptional regulator of adaptative response / methylphosphotriester-DNA alkyltransferase methyltransferase
MTGDQKWQAVLENDEHYDGLFFYGVKSTKIFCRPSCKSKPPLKKNIVYFETEKQAEQAGYRPCKRCRPDLLEYRPIKEIAEKVKLLLDEAVPKSGSPGRTMILELQPIKTARAGYKITNFGTGSDNCFLSQKELAKKMGQIGVTHHRVVAIFKEYYGVTPKKYYDNLRIGEAKKKLLETNDTIIDIAYSVGFQSLSAFYKFFQKNVNLPPSKYRKEHNHGIHSPN